MAAVADGIYHVQSLATGYRLDGNAYGAIYGHSPNDGAYQKWRLTYVGDNSYHVQSLATGYRLDGNADGAIYGHSPNDGAYQKWLLIPTQA